MKSVFAKTSLGHYFSDKDSSNPVIPKAYNFSDKHEMNTLPKDSFSTEVDSTPSSDKLAQKDPVEVALDCSTSFKDPWDDQFGEPVSDSDISIGSEITLSTYTRRL